MANAESPHRPPHRRWLRFTDGSQLPAFGWGGSFQRAFNALRTADPSAAPGLLVVALGNHPEDVATLSFGTTTPFTEARTVHDARMIEESEQADGVHKGVFTDSYRRLIESAGVGIADVVLLPVNEERTAGGLVHFGERSLSELRAPIGDLALSLYRRAGLEPPAHDVPAMQLSTSAPLKV
jgi:hypothetical protein